MAFTRRFMQIRGHWYALMNQRAQGTPTDTVVLRPMAPQDVATYRMMIQSGFVEAAIFAQLYPPNLAPVPVQDVIVPVVLLTKGQLAYLIESKLGISVPSLMKMKKEDLMILLGRL